MVVKRKISNLFKISYASLWLSGVKRNERKENPFLSAEVGSYHFEVWGAAVCCTFLFARFAKVPRSLSWWASLGRSHIEV